MKRMVTEKEVAEIAVDSVSEAIESGTIKALQFEYLVVDPDKTYFLEHPELVIVNFDGVNYYPAKAAVGGFTYFTGDGTEEELWFLNYDSTAGTFAEQ